MPIDLDKLERLEREATPGPWAGGNAFDVFTDDDAARRGEPGTYIAHTDPSQDKEFDKGRADRDLIVALRNAAPAMVRELRALRARVAELEEDNEWLRGVVRTSCVRKPTPGCDCPGCETARERSAQVDLVASYEAELEEDRQAERDRILGARVREVLEANGTNPERFVSEWCRAQAEYETEEAAR